MNKAQAIQSLRPGAHWVLRDEEMEWLDTIQVEPTDIEISDEIVRLKTEYDYLEYARNRAKEYAKLNQDELRFDDLVNGTTIWQDTILSIKNKFPKP